MIRVTEARLNAANAIHFRRESIALVDSGATRLVIDLGQVSFVDSSGLAALVAVLKRVGITGSLAISGLQPVVRRMFELTRMDRVFHLYPDAASARSAIAA